MKKKFETPLVLQVGDIRLEKNFLGGSIVDDAMNITSTGQEVVEINAGDTDFDWNNQWTWE